MSRDGNGQGHGHGGHGQGQGHGHGHGVGQPADFAAAAEQLDLDAEVFRSYLDDVVALVAEASAGSMVSRIADLGSGSGTGTLALAERFPQADVMAVDMAEPLLSHVTEKARDRGVAGRVQALHADLDEGWPPQLFDLDLVWASTSLHHVADPPATLAAVRSALVPSGLLALLEVDDLARFQPLFLPGQDTVETRVRAALIPDVIAEMPYLEADWPAVLTDAGFTVELDRVFELTLRPPLPTVTGRYAALNLQRLREQLRHLEREDQLTTDDLATLDELIGAGPGAVQHRDDLVPRSRRRVFLARRS